MNTVSKRSTAPNLSSNETARQIFSRNNARIKRIRDLQNRSTRDHSGLFYVDGVRFVAQANDLGAHIDTLLISPALLTNPLGKTLVRRANRNGTQLLSVPPEVYHSISLAEEPQGIGAVVNQRWDKLESIHPHGDLCWIALDSIHSPGNLGTLLRTSEAVGAAGLILLGDTVDPYDPTTVRASMGAIFGQRFVRTTLTELILWKKSRQVALIGTSPNGPMDYQSVQYRPPQILFMGGERQGLSKECLSLCDRVVRIPMVGKSDSLNLGVATSVLLYEVFNQHRKLGSA